MIHSREGRLENKGAHMKIFTDLGLTLVKIVTNASGKNKFENTIFSDCF